MGRDYGRRSERAAVGAIVESATEGSGSTSSRVVWWCVLVAAVGITAAAWFTFRRKARNRLLVAPLP